VCDIHAYLCISTIRVSELKFVLILFFFFLIFNYLFNLLECLNEFPKHRIY
jgi:hypothetical protein